MTKNYFHWIDALRGIAVLSVLIFHIDESLLPGGFVGVDIFFVISGFVISRAINREIIEGTFRFSTFYSKRFKRLFPALFVLFVAVGLLSFLIGSPTFLKNYSESSISALLGLSNFYFWNEAGYFDSSSEFKPLLHTWTLSVEEQFYFCLPILLVLLSKRSQVFSFCGIFFLLLLSFAISVSFSMDSFGVIGELYKYLLIEQSIEDTAFYFPFFRFYEFLIGVALSYVNLSRITNHKCCYILNVTGLVLLLFSLFYIDSSFNFPSYYALLPCLSASLFIIGGNNYSKSHLFSVLIKIGKVSYSVYLVHWPIIVFWNYIDSSVNWLDKFGMLLLSILIGWALYHFVEKRFRYMVFTFRKFVILYLILCAYITLTISAYYSDGWKWRVISNPNIDFAGSSIDFHKIMYGGAGYPRYGKVDGYELSKDVIATNIVLVGDSFARHYAYGVDHVLKGNLGSLYIAAGTSCLFFPNITRVDANGRWLSKCANAINKAHNIISRSKTKPIVILSHAWLAQMSRSDTLNVDFSRSYSGVRLDNLIEGIKQFKSMSSVDFKLIVIGELPKPNDVDLYDALSRPRLIPFVYESIDSLKFMAVNKNVVEFNEKMSLYASKTQLFDFLNPVDVLCEFQSCLNVDANNRLIYSDSAGHLSKYGSEMMIDFFKPEIVRALN